MKRNERQYQDLLEYLLNRGVPKELAEKTAEIVSSGTTERTRDEQIIVSTAWAIANESEQ